MTRRALAEADPTIEPMPANVCCPNCWTWTEVSSRTTCRRCGVPLILADGRTLDAALSSVPASPPADVGGSSAPPPPPPQVGVPPPPPGRVPRGPGPDWVALARWITLGYGVLVALALIAVGLLVQHITVPLTDPTTGVTSVQVLNVGPAFAIAAIVVAAFSVLFAWLTRFTAARAVFLVLDLLGIVTAISQLSLDVRSGGTGLVGVFNLAVDLAYAGVLLMSILPGARQPTYG